MTTTYRITAASVRDFKRVRSIKITPEADSSILLIGGQNAQGKSSLLDALTVALGGKRAQPADPVRHGAENAEVMIELNGGELSVDGLTIKRVIEKGGESKLEVRDADGAIRSPQQRLDKLIGARFLDPISFLMMPAADQRAQLLSIIDKEGALDKLDERRERLYDKRTEVGRDLNRAKGELERLQPRAAAAEPIDVAALSAERERYSEQQRAGDGLGNVHREATKETLHQQSQLARCRDQIADLERKLSESRSAEATIEAAIAASVLAETEATAKLEAAKAAWTATAERRAQLDADLKRADDHNRAVYETRSANTRRDAAEETVKQLKERTDEQSKMIDKIDAEKLRVLQEAKLPVDGLSVDAAGIALNGVPFQQASAAERYRVALSLAMVAAPGLDDVWIRDGALLDDQSLQAISDFAESTGKRIWIERVGDRDPGAIIIQDGTVRE